MGDRPLRHDIAVALTTVAATAVLGGGLTFCFQERSAEHQREAELREARIVAGTEVFKELGSLMDRRLVAVANLLYAVEHRDPPATLRGLDSAAGDVFHEWNRGRLTNTALVCRYFGPAPARVFVEELGPSFVSLQHATKALVADTPPPGSEQFTAVEREFKRQRVRVFRFNLQLIDRIRRGTVGEGIQEDIRDDCQELDVGADSLR